MTTGQRIPVTVIGGYLGAGKTTLVNHILRSSGERVAVIVNDFGEISIDEDLIVAADGDKLTLANGCICCSLAEGFAAALATIRSADTSPSRLIIEASGVADPAQIAAYGHTPGLRLDAVVVLADAAQVRRQAGDRWVADTVRTQLASADVVVVNKIDLLGDIAEAEDVCDWLADIVGRAAVVRASRAAVPVEVLFGPHLHDDEPAALAGPLPPAGLVPASGAVPAARTAEDLFESQTVVLDRPVPMSAIKALLADLPDGVARLKGLLQALPPDITEGTAAAAGTGAMDAAGYLIEAVGPRTSLTPLRADFGPTPRRWAVSVIAYAGALPSGWLRDRLHAGG